MKSALGSAHGLVMLLPMKLRLLFLSLSLFLTACTSMVIGGGQASGVYNQHDDRTLQQVSKDTNITQAVQRILNNYTTIDVDTANGIVTLQGKVNSRDEITQIINQVYLIDGVQRVESYLVVSPP